MQSRCPLSGKRSIIIHSVKLVNPEPCQECKARGEEEYSKARPLPDVAQHNGTDKSSGVDPAREDTGDLSTDIDGLVANGQGV